MTTKMITTIKETVSVTLPNERQRERFCDVLHYAFSDIRAYLQNGDYRQAEELANIFHNIPQEMYGIGLWNLPTLVNRLRKHQKKYGGRNYVSYLNKIFEETNTFIC
jgi:hypothetical protein